MTDRRELQRTLDAFADARGLPRHDLSTDNFASGSCPTPQAERSHGRDSSAPEQGGATPPPNASSVRSRTNHASSTASTASTASRSVRLARARDLKAARARARAERAAERDRQWFVERRELATAAGWHPDSVFAAPVWRAGMASQSDHAGHAAQREYDRMPPAIRGCVKRAIAGRDFRNSRARGILGVMAVLWRQARLTRAQSRRRLVVEYVSYETLASALYDRTSMRKPARSTLQHAWHRPGGDEHNGQIGWHDALRKHGAFHWLQERQCADDPTCNQYWLLDPRSPFMNAAQREWLRALELDGCGASESGVARAPPASSIPF